MPLCIRDLTERTAARAARSPALRRRSRFALTPAASMTTPDRAPVSHLNEGWRMSFVILSTGTLAGSTLRTLKTRTILYAAGIAMLAVLACGVAVGCYRFGRQPGAAPGEQELSQARPAGRTTYCCRRHPCRLRRVERSRRGVPDAAEGARHRDPLLPARSGRAPDRSRPDNPTANLKGRDVPI